MSVLRLAYCTNVRLPSERAHGHQVAQVCRALQRNGHAVHVFCPDRHNVIAQDFWTYHDLDRSIGNTHVPCFDGIASPWTPGILGLWATTSTFRRNLLPILRRASFDVLYTRTPEILGTLLRTAIPVVIELHKIPRWGHRRFVRQCNACALIVALTTPMKQALVRMGTEESHIIVEGDAVDLDRFINATQRKRAEILPGGDGASIVTYAGSLASMGMEKGVAEIIDALAVLRKRGARCFGLIIGGPDVWVRTYRVRASEAGLTESDIRFMGHMPAREIPGYLKTSDILVYPAPASRHPYFIRDTSPLKLFEYMAAGKPIVCADLPPVHDVLDADSAAFCIPGSAESLADAIQHFIESPEDVSRKAEAVRKRIPAYTWESRMRRIIEAIQDRITSTTTVRPSASADRTTGAFSSRNE